MRSNDYSGVNLDVSFWVLATRVSNSTDTR